MYDRRAPEVPTSWVDQDAFTRTFLVRPTSLACGGESLVATSSTACRRGMARHGNAQHAAVGQSARGGGVGELLTACPTAASRASALAVLRRQYGRTGAPKVQGFCAGWD